MKKKIALLGSTGSIGKSFLDILKKDKKNCDILLLSVNRNINELLKQLKIFKVRNIVITEKKSFLKIKKLIFIITMIQYIKFLIKKKLTTY